MILDFNDPETYQFNKPIMGGMDINLKPPGCARTNDERDNTGTSATVMFFNSGGMYS